MASAWIVKAVDVLKERRVHLASGAPSVAPYQFSLDRLEDGFHDGIEAPIFVKPVLVRFLVRRGG